MRNIFLGIKDQQSSVDKEIRNYILENSEDALKQINDKITSLHETLNSSDLIDLYLLEAIASGVNVVHNSVLPSLFEFYLKNSDHLIKHDNYSLYILIDLFAHHPEVFKKETIIEPFIHASYPMLTNASTERNSNLDIAIDVFLSMLAFDKRFKEGHNVLRKFIAENANNQYVDDAREKLAEANEG